MNPSAGAKGPDRNNEPRGQATRSLMRKSMSVDQSCDVIVIGGGSAAFDAAVSAKKSGAAAAYDNDVARLIHRQAVQETDQGQRGGR